MDTLEIALLLFSALAGASSVPPPAPVPWRGSSIDSFHTYVLTDRLYRDGKAREGKVEDYARMDDGWIALTFNNESVFRYNPDMRLLRSDLVQFFQMPAGGRLLFMASIKRDSPDFYDARVYQVFFTELKMFEVYVDASDASAPRWIFRVQREERWSRPLEPGRGCNFGVLCDGAAGTVSLFFSEDDEPLELSSVSGVSATIESKPEVHWGPLIYDAGGATLEHSETFMYSGVGVTDRLALRGSP
uniref:Glycoside hydrolase 131 catalytic N-terminal domain-containing protein n=1 Tax=Alexandrium catenella TaxID=2925 RepID=A0A7S1L2S0_ALECA